MKEKILEFFRSPIFIGGIFKSGTTLLRAMLGQHSAIASGLETQWFNIEWGGIRNENFNVHIERLRNFYGFEKSVTDKMVAESKNVVHFINLFLGYYVKSLAKKRWVEKTPGNILHMDKIYSGWPDAKVIHLVRDPRDVFVSLRQAGKWDTVEVFVDLWCRFMTASEEFKNKLNLNSDNYLEIRYEQLVVRPRDSMKKVMGFLDESWEEGVSAFKGKEDDFDKVLKFTGKASTTLDRLRSPLSRDRIGIWSETLSLEEIRQIHDGAEQKGLLPLMRKIEEESHI